MKPILFILLFQVIFIQITWGQQSGKYTIIGELNEAGSSDPLSFVQVALFKQGAEQPITFTDTGEDGSFRLTAPQGTYLLRFFLIGYEKKELPNINLNKNINLGEIEIQNENQDLGEVVVQADKVMMRTNVEGITINPSQNLSNLGGTLLDILRNTPSVRVTDDGSISLRGSTGTNVLINGRNSSLTQNLDQIPASAIEQIRIINNPNARYDAEAEGGIIDIILKKGIDVGTHGGVEAVYGTRGRTSAGVRLNHRTLRYNVYGGYNMRRWRDVGVRRIQREIFGDGESLNQETNTSRENLGHTFNYGVDYYFGNNIISYEGVFSKSEDTQMNTLYSRLTGLEDNRLLSHYVRRNNENELDDGVENALIYERTFKDPGKSLKFSASNSYRNQFKTQRIDIFNNASEGNPDFLTGRERALTDERRYISVFQLDYKQPINEKTGMEMGLKSNIRNFNNDYEYSRFSETSQNFVEDLAVSNRFDYKDRIHAGYFIVSKSSDKFDATVGLRGEYTTVDTYLYNTDERNQQEYFNLFPSLQSLYKINEEHSIKFTYSRRIDRPTAWRLNPFPDITDSLNVRRGNPNLQPEMINSLELGHVLNTDKSSFTSNVFYRQVKGQLDFITTIEDGVSFSQPENLNNAESLGLEIIGVTEITDWWSINGSVTGFRINVDGSNISEEFTNSGFAWNTKMATDFKLPLAINFQLVFNYESPEIEAQGRDLSQYYADASLQKSFFSNKASLIVSLRDIFDTRRFAGFARTQTFSQEFYAKRETRILLFSARYNF